jgi:hypothetical protein
MIATSKIDRFINLMLQNDEQMRLGFELILKKEDFVQFFDRLKAEGLFAAERSPGPVPAKEPGSVHIPYWSALDYLVACAKQAGEQNNLDLGRKIMAVIREVSVFIEPDGSVRENYHTGRKFAEILGLLPNEVTTHADMDLVQRWLSDRFDRGLVCNALDEGVMHRFLCSERPEDWKKALRITFHCTALKPAADKDELHTVVDDYWLKKFIEHHAEILGKKVGPEAAELFYARLHEVFGKGTRFRFSYLFRPAIEEHSQNMEWYAAENCMVVGLRDLLIGWVDTDADAVIAYIKRLLDGELEIARRISLHVIDIRWQQMSDLFAHVLSPCLFEIGHRHELYWLLSNHFKEMTRSLQTKVVAAIRDLTLSKNIEDYDHQLRSYQMEWLSSITGKGCEEADQWFDALGSGENPISLSKHPDFLSYSESSSGSGPSPFQKHELIAFAQDGSLIDFLNGFQPTGHWDGPSIRSLASILEEAVLDEPTLFLQILPKFIDAKRPYQYAILAGMKRLWDKPSTETTIIDWDNAWGRIIEFLEKLLQPESFWSEEVTDDFILTPTRNWISPVIADLLKAGTQDDQHAYAPSFFPKTTVLIKILLEKASSEEGVSDDPMSQAINSSKGKAIEAFFSLALRVCRLADRSSGNHKSEWKELQPLADRELSKCRDGNYDFSTLAAAYLANFEYLDVNWLSVNISKIFPEQWPNNFKSAMGGLAYAHVTKRCYALLLEAGTIDIGIRFNNIESKFKTRLIERVALAYLWGDEELSSPRFHYWFDNGDEDAIKVISRFFWSVKHQTLTPEQIGQIKAFWMACLTWSDTQSERPGQVLSSLSKLACYVDTVNESDIKLLKATAPYCELSYNTTEFIENLNRLAADNSKIVYQVLTTLLETYVPTYDYEGRLLSIVQKLVDQGLVEEAMWLADKLRQLPRMRELFKRITNI